MIESKLRTKVMNSLKRWPGVWVYKASDRYTSGVPDIIGCRQGKMFAIELKAEHGRVSKIQEWTMHELKRAGAAVAVIRSMDEFYDFFAGVV